MSTKQEAISVSSNINIVVTVIAEPSIKMVKNGTMKLTEVQVADAKGDTIKLTLFESQGEGVVEGSRLQLTNANTSEFRGETSLSIPRWGKVSILSEGDLN